MGGLHDRLGRDPFPEQGDLRVHLHLHDGVLADVPLRRLRRRLRGVGGVDDHRAIRRSGCRRGADVVGAHHCARAASILEHPWKVQELKREFCLRRRRA